MADCVEGPVAVEEKHASSEVQEMELQNAEEHSAASEVTTETETVSVLIETIEKDKALEETNEVVQVAKAEGEESIPEECSVAAEGNDSGVVVCETAIIQVTVEVEHVTDESKEMAEESSQSSSKKRKSDDDEETSGEEVKKQKTEETAAADEAVKSNDDVPVEESAPPADAVETAVMDIVIIETEAKPAETIIPEVPEESEIKSNEEETIDAPVEKEKETEVVSDQPEEKDLSENKENEIDETISNGTMEKEPTKMVESVEEEAIKILDAKALDETDQPTEAEAVSS